VVSLSYLQIKEHSRKKYQILGKYLRACQRFSNIYRNFAYVDTHGGSGKVLDAGNLTDGSTLIAAKVTPSFPCYVIEIDRLRFTLLKDSCKAIPHVTPFFGDCNTEIDRILSLIPKGKMFVFFFVDPDGLAYQGKDRTYDELTAETVEKIATFPRTELLLNLPLQAIMECAGYIRELPGKAASEKMRERVSTFFGTERWLHLDCGDYKAFMRLYVSQRLEAHYQYIGGILVRNVMRGPQYYLLYGSKHSRGGEIMRDIMKKEHVDTVGFPLTRHQYETDREWLDAEYPLNKPFVFEN
jgi:three-Cys-motif partner protein